MIAYKIQFYSYWAVGTGIGAGSSKDSLVIKDATGLPFIPGKTMKGLLRAAASDCLTAMELENKDLEKLFGHTKHSSEEQDTENIVGSLKFSSAVVPVVVHNTLSKNTELKAGIYETKTSTRLDMGKQAVNHSLRKNEICIPLELTGTISSDNNLEGNEKLLIENALKMLRLIGEKRHRGLGRCKITFEIK